MVRHAFNLLAAAGLAACANPTTVQPVVDTEVGQLPSRVIVEGTPEAYGVLAFLNHPSTTQALLDHEVGLDRRAAESIIAHRNGPDGQLGTGKDDLYQTIEEVDARYYVGDTALRALVDWVSSTGQLPGPTDVVGSWDGVTLTLAEADAVLFAANQATAYELDDVIGLDSRAVGSILSNREITSMEQLSGLYYVGASAIGGLRDWGLGQLEDPAAGEGESCDTTEDCASGLICLGEYQYDHGLFCADQSQAGFFENDIDAGPIPDNGMLASPVQVSGLATVPVDIIVMIELDHPRPADLVVTLHDPNGNVGVVWNRADSPASEVVVRNGIPGDDMVNGTWTLQVEDVVTGQVGELYQWSLYLTSNWD